jgi:hypothetical protein
MTSEGASRCAKRTNIEEVETARIAVNRLKGSRRRIRCAKRVKEGESFDLLEQASIFSRKRFVVAAFRSSGVS